MRRRSTGRSLTDTSASRSTAAAMSPPETGEAGRPTAFLKEAAGAGELCACRLRGGRSLGSEVVLERRWPTHRTRRNREV